MAKLMSRCPFCDMMTDSLGAIIVTGKAVVRAYRCGTYVHRDESVDVYTKACVNG